MILEVNHWQPTALRGVHDIYYGTALPPNRKPIPLLRPDSRIVEPWLQCDPDKVVAVVETDAPDRNTPFDLPDAASKRNAENLLEFFRHEITLRDTRLPLGLGTQLMGDLHVSAEDDDGGSSARTACPTLKPSASSKPRSRTTMSGACSRRHSYNAAAVATPGNRI
ncbi:hypothetical protein J2X04_000852 [Lysobacter niabensis]|uniref:Uncharacterized protein n=1 Tax=Agrilutibacter niabensis TaxID=380628 RepID=A0ABU1VME5_9GAMM|nr:hypothetical protein [Lysobacter niabensis]